jgi:hypothetical protein
MGGTGGTAGSKPRREPVPADVFISFYNEDEKVATRTCDALTKHGIGCFISSDNIRGGAQFHEVIDRSLRAARVVVLILSNKTQKSGWVPKEVNLAINLKKTIIPFQIEDKIEGAIALMVGTEQHVKGWPGPKQEHVDELVKAVRRALGSAEYQSVTAKGTPKEESPTKPDVGRGKSVLASKPALSERSKPNLLLWGSGAGAAIALGWGIISLLSPAPKTAGPEGCGWLTDSAGVPVKVTIDEDVSREEDMKYFVQLDNAPECAVPGPPDPKKGVQFYAPEGHNLNVRLTFTEDGRTRIGFAPRIKVARPTAYAEIKYED